MINNEALLKVLMCGLNVFDINDKTILPDLKRVYTEVHDVSENTYFNHMLEKIFVDVVQTEDLQTAVDNISKFMEEIPTSALLQPRLDVTNLLTPKKQNVTIDGSTVLYSKDFRKLNIIKSFENNPFTNGMWLAVVKDKLYPDILQSYPVFAEKYAPLLEEGEWLYTEAYSYGSTNAEYAKTLEIMCQCISTMDSFTLDYVKEQLHNQ